MPGIATKTMSLYVNHTLNKLHKLSFCGSLNSWITKQCIALTVLKYKLKILTKILKS